MANMVLGIIRNYFLYLDKKSFMCLYKATVRPHLEYASQVWAPRYQRQIDTLENDQRRATRLLPGLKHLLFEDRLKYLKLPTLTPRRLRGDLIEVYKMVTSKYDPDVCENQIKLRQGSKTRAHSYKIFKEQCYKNLRKNSFPHRVIDTSNSLPEPVVKANTVVPFESRLDKFTWYSVWLSGKTKCYWHRKYQWNVGVRWGSGPRGMRAFSQKWTL